MGGIGLVNIRTFDLNLLRALHALLENCNVSAAARQLNLSQPATSAALSRLRHALGAGFSCLVACALSKI
jgi:hypothetical protein